MFTTDHVAISVENLPETIKFYKLFGFEVLNQYEADDKSYRILMLANSEGKYIEVFHYTNHGKAPDFTATTATDLPVLGTKHMAFRVEDIDEAVKFAVNNGIGQNLKVNTGRLGRKYFFLKDPNGILVEIIEKNTIK